MTPAQRLKRRMEELRDASNAGDSDEKVAIVRELLPDEGALAEAMRPDVDPSITESIREMHAELREASDARISRAFDIPPERSVVRVHAATGAEIEAYERGSTAYDEFPGGARKLAGSVLDPDVTYYEVEFTEPGESLGTKYHLFYESDDGWKMLGPIWRVVRD
jgi:hypothetical protein